MLPPQWCNRMCKGPRIKMSYPGPLLRTTALNATHSQSRALPGMGAASWAPDSPVRRAIDSTVTLAGEKCGEGLLWGLRSSWGETISSSRQPGQRNKSSSSWSTGRGAPRACVHVCLRVGMCVCVWACACNHLHSCSTESGTYESLCCEAASAGTTRDPADTPYGGRGGRGMLELRNNRWSFF